MIATILVRMPIDLNNDDPQVEAARTLCNIIVDGISSLRGYVPQWFVELDEDRGIITVK